jgi:dTDP-4-amino-4,6-dideoxygalactose transaminase
VPDHSVHIAAEDTDVDGAGRKATLPQAAPARAPIPVLRPLLPRATELLPYLERIDASRVYSNWGPLVQELSVRLAGKLGAPERGLVCANSGMSAIVGAILATAGLGKADRPLAIIPDYTFTATALSVLMCGYQPVLASCAAGSWDFGPADLAARPDVLSRAGLVMPVAPYGRVVTQAPWVEFQARTGIPVVIDAAACFDLLAVGAPEAIGPLPIALSFHATKSYGMGEGGCVISTDASLAENVLRCLNFGFLEARNTAMVGTNGKMSEYVAAVGLAELDGWDRKHAAALQVSHLYELAFAAAGVRGRLWGPPDISCAYAVLECASREEADAVIAALAADHIDTRRWYGLGLRDHDAFSGCEMLQLHGGAALDARLLVGLPIAVDLAAGDVERICAAIGVGQRSVH